MGTNEILGMDAYSPAEIEEKVEKLGVKKANTPPLASFMLSMVAGGSIGLGAMYYCIVISDPTLGFAASRLLGGLVFCLGLALVLIAGAELFTGNNLIAMAWADGKVGTGAMLRNWTRVWFGNLVGTLVLVFLVYMAHHTDLNGGRVGLAVLQTAAAKAAKPMVTVFFAGILCNMLVCLAVWLAMAGRTVTDKILGLMLPVSAFVAAGFEHSIANMYYFGMALALKATGHVPEGFDDSAITLLGAMHNIIPATLGNIVGGSGFVGIVYYVIYRKGFGAKPAPAPEPALAGGSVMEAQGAVVKAQH
ncbi:formate/nitrite transporter family protein [Azospirillum halopraeferens]|uniref:formate/nitrite transporter family protein n=1 Tax=Azospirillum halopraeferens TaxID=34010 RepID=UPI0003F92181|nr:formate/nitrite transporter family protein [Azospirillum halopraeferens]